MPIDVPTEDINWGALKQQNQENVGRAFHSSLGLEYNYYSIRNLPEFLK